MSRSSWYVPIVALLAALLGFAGAVQAQVAAPRLNTAAPTAGDAFNPAVILWGGGSRAGVIVAPKADVEFTPSGGPAVPFADGNGVGLQLALVGQNFGFAAATNTLNFDLDATAFPPGGTHEIKNNLISVAARAGQSITLGVGLESSEETDEPTGGTSSTDKTSMPLGGAVWRLGDTFFIGGTWGPQNAESSSGGAAASGDRKVTRVGAGFYWRKAETGFHLEAYHENDSLLDLTDDVTQTSVLIEKGSLNGVTLEAVFSNILIGIEAKKSSFEQAITGSPVVETIDETEQTFSVGWVPEKGMVFVVGVQTSEAKDKLSGDMSTVDAATLGVAWQF